MGGKIKIIDLFGGIGGFRYGIENAGIKTKCVLYADIDKYATAVYNYNFKENWKPTDITKLKSEDIPDHDILCGGFPCQSFSTAGKRKGFNDTRGTLFFEICRIARDKKSPVLFLENVKGLLSHGNRTTGIFYDKRKKTYSTKQTRGSDEVTLKASGETFGIIANTLYELDYLGEAGTLNSKHFGVPQNRERVFIIGHLRGQRSRQVFPLGQDGGTADDLQGQSTNTLTARYEGAQAIGSYIVESELDEKENKEIIIEGCKINQPATIDLYHFKHGEKRPATSRIMDDGNSATISAAQPLSLINNGRIRRLTPTECMRLQGFPDSWCDYGLIDGKVVEISDTQKYKMAGNSVTTNVIQAIAEKLMEDYNDKESNEEQ